MAYTPRRYDWSCSCRPWVAVFGQRKPAHGGKTSSDERHFVTEEELTAAFLKTPEMVELAKIAGEVNAKVDPGDTQTVCVKVPKQLIRLMDFMERKYAAVAGRKPASVAKALSQIATNELHDDLHLATVAPLTLEYYRKLWNQFCDERGAPEYKLGT